MFESVRVAGNNMFIDNVSVNIQTEISEEGIPISENLNVYPNPSNGKIFIKSNKNIQGGTLMVYNSQGNLVFKSTISDTEKTLSYDLSGYPHGIYVLRIIGGNFIANEKMIIK